jgi:hypothetical protein
MLRSFVRYYSDPKTNKILTQNLDREMYSMMDTNASRNYATEDDMLKGMYENLMTATIAIDDHFIKADRNNFFKVAISAINGFETV